MITPEFHLPPIVWREPVALPSLVDSRSRYDPEVLISSAEADQTLRLNASDTDHPLISTNRAKSVHFKGDSSGIPLASPFSQSNHSRNFAPEMSTRQPKRGSFAQNFYPDDYIDDDTLKMQSISYRDLIKSTDKLVGAKAVVSGNVVLKHKKKKNTVVSHG